MTTRVTGRLAAAALTLGAALGGALSGCTPAIPIPDEPEATTVALQLLQDGGGPLAAELAVGDDLLLWDPGFNASIGDEWTVLDPGDPAVLAYVDSTYRPDDPDPTLVGGGGSLAFTWHAVAPGTTTLELQYAYRQEAGTETSVTVLVTVR